MPPSAPLTAGALHTAALLQALDAPAAPLPCTPAAPFTRASVAAPVARGRSPCCMRSQEAARLERQAAASGGAAGALVAGSLVCLMGFAAAGAALWRWKGRPDREQVTGVRG